MPPTEAPPALAAFTLATDLDGTFAGGSLAARDAVARAIRARRGGRLIYVTGRSTASWRALAREADLPVPHVAITDVGTSVIDGVSGEPIAELEARIAARWPGAELVRSRLAGVPGIAEQDIDAPRRVSYDLIDGPLAHALERVAARLEGIDVHLVGSADRYVDVLPGGVNKGTTLLAVLDWLRVARGEAVVAGDSLNDLALFETGLKAILVANAEPELRERVGDRPHVFAATAPGADGIREGLTHFGVLPGADDG